MLISHAFSRPQPDRVRLIPGVFIALITFFTAMAWVSPVVSLTGLGTVAIVAAALVELNAQKIWADYKKASRKKRRSMWTEPQPIFFTINVALLWPFVAFLGAVCLWSAVNV